MPLELYLGHTDEFEPDADYVDGEIELRPMGDSTTPRGDKPSSDGLTSIARNGTSA